MRRMTWPIYFMTLSIVAVIAMIGYTIREDHIHRQQLSRAVEAREAQINQFLVELCDRLQVRDDIQINYLQVAVARYARLAPEYAEALARAATALEVTQSGCLEGIPSTEEGG